MKLLKTTTVILCMSVSACSYFPKSGETAAQAPEPQAKVVQQEKPEAQAKTEGTHWWWPFGKGDKTVTEAKAQAKPQKLEVSQAWLDEHEKTIREAIAGSKVKMERREDGLVLIANVDDSFNPDRAEMLLPSMLGPLGRTAKLVFKDDQSAVIVLGHTDSTGTKAVNDQLSLGRAKAVASIFRLSGLGGNRLVVRGLSDTQPRAANDSSEGRALNRRVEVLIQPRSMVLASLQSMR
jgi:outer membrane protein OmpA-like peptidoglycan-associated protein